MLLAERRARYRRVSEYLASRSDAELAALTSAETVLEGRGEPVTLEVDGVPVFAKHLALTDLELAHPRSTANLFGLPTFCHFFFGLPNFPRFGFGGPAINGWRELAASLIVSDGVLAGDTESFPLLYHWRVLPVRPRITAQPSDVQAVVTILDGSPAVRDRLEALRTASHSLVLFYEHIPQPVTDWLRDGPAGKAEIFEEQLFQVVAFLNDRQLLHLDGQLGNMRTDGERIYLTDFGLATSPRFNLTSAERDFVATIATMDADYAALRLVHWLATDVCGVPGPGAKDPHTGERPNWQIRAEFVQRCAAGDLPAGLSPTATGILTRHAASAWRAFRFYRKLFNDNLHTAYPTSDQTITSQPTRSV